MKLASMAADFDTGPADALKLATSIDLAFGVEHGGYRTPAGARIGGVAGTMLVAAIAVAACFLTWTRFQPMHRASAPLVVSLLPLASLPEPEKPVERKPKVPPKKETPPRPAEADSAITVPPVTAVSSAPAHVAEQPKAAPPPVEQTPPKPISAPAAPQPATNAPDSWEGQVLARIAKYRRYPGSARSAHQQGIVYIRFRMDRAGHVLTASIVRSSGYPDLDRAALDTLHRADPLPPIPADRPDELELSVPIEFYIR